MDSTARLELLEATSAHLGGFELGNYRDQSRGAYLVNIPEANTFAAAFADRLRALPMPPGTALSALAQPAIDAMERRRTGSFYTDFRLARFLAHQLVSGLPDVGEIVDPACGSGILLVAVADALKEIGWEPEAIVGRLRGVDLSSNALRATRLSVASIGVAAKDLDVLADQFVQADSLLEPASFWERLAPDGIAAVVANPPWEKLKLTRHELLLAAGVERHYGAGYDLYDVAAANIEGERRRLGEYVARLNTAFEHQGSGEDDLYKLFLELGLRLVGRAGRVAMLLPASFLRNAGARQLREVVLEEWDTDVTILENRAAFFQIDSRFKFLTLVARPRTGGSAALSLGHSRGLAYVVEAVGAAELDIPRLKELRPDLTVPEVKSEREWALFEALSSRGAALAQHPEWNLDIAREVDMTNDRSAFLGPKAPNALAVIEGRMVHQFRFPVKAYDSGSGRRALWRVLEPGDPVTPQFRIRFDALRPDVQRRVSQARIGFCDVTGQTNERTVLAALIPPNVVCGNKVPTIILGPTQSAPRQLRALWLAIANSLVFDWLARRVVTTSLNFFVLLGLPFPLLTHRPDTEKRISNLGLEVLAATNHSQHGPGTWGYGVLRARLDAAVATAWSIGLADMELVFADFPLLDRGQRALPGESRSTVTRDLVLYEIAKTSGEQEATVASLSDRVERARGIGSVGFTTSEHVKAEDRRDGVGRGRSPRLLSGAQGRRSTEDPGVVE